MSSDESSGSHSHEVPSTVESDSLISLNFQGSDGASTRFSITGDRGIFSLSELGAINRLLISNL